MPYSEKQIVIMEAAEKLFAEKGFDGTSVRDIAEHADVNLAMISYYFGSKEKLLESLFDFRGESSVMKLESMFSKEHLTSLEKVYDLIDYYIDKFLSQHCFHKIMSREQVTNQRGSTSLLIQKFKKRNQDMITELVKEGQRKNEFKKNIDVPLMMATMVGTVSHLVTTQHYYRAINDLESMEDQEFQQLIKTKLSAHLKSVFKEILTNE